MLGVATGTSSELARFQARSAFTGVGFTTSEAESVVLHPVRYGRGEILADLDTRRAGSGGERAHEMAVVRRRSGAGGR